MRSPPSGSGSAILLSPSMFPVYDNPSRRWSFRRSHLGLPGRKSPCFVAAFYLLEGRRRNSLALDVAAPASRTDMIRILLVTGVVLVAAGIGLPPGASGQTPAQGQDLMVSGLLPRIRPDGSLVDESGRAVPGQRHVGPSDLSASCIVCDDPGPQVSYQAPLGLVLHLHVTCDTLWQEEQPPPRR